MPLCVIHICGPHRAGKTDFAKQLARSIRPNLPHHLQLVRWDGRGPQGFVDRQSIDGMYESRVYAYSPERIFEQLPAALRAIKQTRRWATVILETDTDPCHRQSFDYNVRVFVSHAPARIDEVFRPPQEAARLMKSIMQDSYLFAQEVYGLVPDPILDESRFGVGAMADGGLSRDEAGLTDTAMGRLLSTEVGQDVACRIQLQPTYYPVVDSDLVVLNTGRGSASSAVDDVARKIESLQAKLGRVEREPMLAVCDLNDDTDPMQQNAIARASDLVAEVTSEWP